MLQHNRAGSRQAQPHSAGVFVTRTFKPIKGYEHLFMALHSNARPAIEHAHRHLFIVATQFNGRLAGVFDGVVQQVGDHTLKAQRAPEVHQVRGATEGNVDGLVTVVIHQSLQKFGQIK